MIKGAARFIRVSVDVMIGEKFFKTFRGEVVERPIMMENGDCIWDVKKEDLKEAVEKKWPSLKEKNYKIFFNYGIPAVLAGFSW